MSFVAFAVVLTVALSAQQAPIRDQQRFTSSGSAVVRGKVVADDAAHTPLRRAQVTLSRAGAEDIRPASTDDQGEFTFSELPPGTYSLSAAKGGFIAMNAGAVKPGMPGRQVMLRERDAVVVPPIALPRGAVIAGRIIDSAGLPVANASVQVSRFVTVNGERLLRSGLATWNTTTNDHGEYRIFGLYAGDYVVFASYSLMPRSDVTAAELDAARRPAESTSAAAPVAPPRLFALAPTLYPSTVDESSATPIALAAGEERLGVDISLQRVPVARVSGTLLGTDGKPIAGATVLRGLRRLSAFVPSAVTGVVTAPDGSFALVGLAPGDYVLQARGPSGVDLGRAEALARPGFAQYMRGLWASTDITVSGADVSGVTLRMQPGMTVSGEVTAAAPDTRPDVSGVRVQLLPVGGGPATSTFTATVSTQGSFGIEGVPPGRYRLAMLTLPATYLARSAMFGDLDLLDAPFEVRAGAGISGITITLTNIKSELSGILSTASGQPASHLYVLAFSQDRAHWNRNSRRILAARAGEDGSYTISGLPAGNYFLCALTEIDTTLQFEAEYLDQLIPASLKLSLADGEKKVQSLRVGG